MTGTPRIVIALTASAIVQATLIGCTSSSPGAPSAIDAGMEGGDAASRADGSMEPPGQCRWPASLNDAGPGSCSFGRAYVECTYSSGVVCEGGAGVSGPSRIVMTCISDDPTTCSGCEPSTGTVSCKSLCAPDEYAVSCGGPPRPLPDGGFAVDYQEAPDACVGIAGTPAGNLYSCCPCE